MSLAEETEAIYGDALKGLIDDEKCNQLEYTTSSMNQMKTDADAAA